MTAAQIKRQVEEEPFRPFQVETTWHTVISVNQRDQIQVSPFHPYLIVVFETDGTFYTVAPGDIASTRSLANNERF